MTPTTIDEGKLNDLLGRFVMDMGATMQAPLMTLGAELGLYDALAAGPATTGELAEKVGCVERYVREWARGQAAAGYVTYDPATDRYSLTPEQALLFDPDGPAYILGGFEVALGAGKARPRLAEAFRTGDGIGWHEHDEGVFCGTAKFFGAGYRAHLVTSWIPALEGVEEKLRAGGRVADIGCGHGVSTLVMAEAFPATSVVGFDYHEGSVEEARARAAERGLEQRLRFLRATAKDFPGADYDLVTMFDCLHDLGDPVGAAAHALQALAPDGTLMIVEPRAGDRVEENLNPVGRVYYAASTLVCTPASLSQEVGLALGAQAGEAAIREVVEAAGFTRFRRAAETPFNLIFEARP